MADPITSPRDPADGNNLARAAAVGPRVDETNRDLANKATNDWIAKASEDLDAWFETHVRNSKLSQRTDLYNAAFALLRDLKELFSRVA